MSTYVTSATQLTTARMCMRKWAWKYVAGIDEPPSQPLELGKKVHSILEAYLKHGTVPNPNETWRFKEGSRLFYVGRIALTMFSSIMPKPGVGHVEGGLTMEISGVKLRAFLDWWDYYNQAHTITIIDHKTSSDPGKWGKTEKTLRDDLQPIIYARMLLERYPGAAVGLHWNYGSTDAVQSKAKVVSIQLSPGDVYAKFEKDVVPLARLLKSHVEAKTDPLTLPPNADVCDMFGGCPHRTRCNLTTEDRIGAFLMSENSLIDQLLAAPPAAMPAPVAGDVVNPPEAAPAGGPPTAPAAVSMDALLGAAAPPPAPGAVVPLVPGPVHTLPAPVPLPAPVAADPALAEVVANRVVELLIARLTR